MKFWTIITLTAATPAEMELDYILRNMPTPKHLS